MKRRILKRRNPMAAMVRKLKPKRIPSVKAYRRSEKHKDRSFIKKWDGPFSFLRIAIDLLAGDCRLIWSLISTFTERQTSTSNVTVRTLRSTPPCGQTNCWLKAT